MDSTTDADFDWVKALHNCSPLIEFTLIKRAAEQNVKQRQQFLPSSIPIRFVFRDIDAAGFQVAREPQPGAAGVISDVNFTLVDQKSIYIHGTVLGKKVSSTLTLTLNDDGECRFKVDGEGEFLRWQVMRRFLEKLLFELL